MIKLFVKGLIFGAGFAVALVAVFIIFSQYQISSFTPPEGGSVSYETMNEWGDLSIAERVEKSSVVALIRFNKEPDKLNSAYVAQILKKAPSTKIDIGVGQRMEESDFYSNEGSRDRNGVIAFYTEHSSHARGKAYLYDDRLVGSGDMPLKVFLKLFEKSKSGKLNTQSQIQHNPIEDMENFHKLTIDQKIEKSSAILLTEFGTSKEGELTNIIVEVLKKADGIDLYYEVGDEYQTYGRSAVDGKSDYIGEVVFMDRSPARTRYSVTYNDRGVRGLDNIALSLLRQKCDEQQKLSFD